jgi:hypothetical protein
MGHSKCNTNRKLKLRRRRKEEQRLAAKWVKEEAQKAKNSPGTQAITK